MPENVIIQVNDNTHLEQRIPQIQDNVVKLTGLQLQNLLGQGEPDGVTPKDTGHLAGSFRKTESREKIIMSTSAKYAEYLNEGTGIYGPRGKPIVIVPKKKKVLFWGTGASKKVVIKGIKPRRFVEKAIQELDDKMPNILQQAVDKSG